MDAETAYQEWLAIGQNYELDRFAVTRVAFMAGRASLPTGEPKTLTDEQIDRIAENCAKSMDGGIQGFCKTWGWRQFARELLDICAGYERTGDAGEPVAQDFHEKFGTTPADAATPTPKPMVGRWWLIAPDGSDFQGDSPIDCIKAEIASRVPARVALARIAEGLNEPDGDECVHDECDDEGTCYECGKAHCR